MLKKMINYIRDVYILKKKIGYLGKKKYNEFGLNSYIQKPILNHNYESIHIGNNVSILKNSRIQAFVTKENENPQIYIGSDSYIVYNVSILAGDNIIIGENVTIASNVLISSEGHGMNPENELSYLQQPLIAQSVIIGRGVWIGEKAIILPGVEIGEKSIIGAGSVVTKSIPAYTIAVGNPAKPIKKYNFNTHIWDVI